MKIKKLIPGSRKTLAWASFTTGVLLAGLAMAQPTPPPASQPQTRSVIVTADEPGEKSSYSFSSGTGSSGGGGSSPNVIQIESIEPDRANEPAREVTWLGLSTEEASEALASQLGLKPGQGLMVIFVAPDSPAAKSGIQKFDVIEQLGDQMLVDPVQLRKLVQMQKEGDTIKLTLYRGGKKQAVSATLAKRTEGLAKMSVGSGEGGELSQLAFSMADMHRQMIDKKTMNAEVQRSMEEARKEIQEALRQSAEASRAARAVAPVAPQPPIPPVPPVAADVGDDATITVTKDGNSVKTIVRSDDSGEIVIVASPKKHLTAHDEDGKLLFDGEIESAEQQAKVPASLWKKVKPMLHQIKPPAEGEPQPHAQTGTAPKL
jgi:PDZ domain